MAQPFSSSFDIRHSLMPPRLRLETERSLQISEARLSPRYGCGLMLKNLPKFDYSDPLLNVMGNYGYTRLAADKPAQKIIDNSGLLKSFYENAFEHKLPMRRNFFQVYGEKEVLMAYDLKAKTVWFIAEPRNRMALVNYFRDSVSLGLKALGVKLVGSTVRLTSVGWQNLHDLLTDAFVEIHPKLKQVEVASVLSGVRWREPNLGLGVTLLNFREHARIKASTEAAMRGEKGGEIQD